jgi:hypothetical protein
VYGNSFYTIYFCGYQILELAAPTNVERKPPTNIGNCQTFEKHIM